MSRYLNNRDIPITNLTFKNEFFFRFLFTIGYGDVICLIEVVDHFRACVLDVCVLETAFYVKVSQQSEYSDCQFDVQKRVFFYDSYSPSDSLSATVM